MACAGQATRRSAIVPGGREPVDLELDPATRTLYWTDRGDPPKGNTVNRAPIDAANGHQEPPEILSTHLMKDIGIAVELRGERMFVADLGGNIYVAILRSHHAPERRRP